MMNDKVYDKIYGVDKASLMRRFSAFLLDAILIIIVTTGFALLISAITGYQKKLDALDNKYLEYETLYDVKLQITSVEYDELSDEEKAKFDEAIKEFQKDKTVIAIYNEVISITLMMVSLSLFFAFLIGEFIIPIIFKNGQTIGKKIFGICVVKNNCVKITNVALFIRSILGKFTIETMIPMYIFIMVFMGSLGFLGTIIIGLILLLQIVLIIATKNHTNIHDLMAYTVVVDKNSQMIFDSEDALIEFKKEKNKEQVEASKKY